MRHAARGVASRSLMHRRSRLPSPSVGSYTAVPMARPVFRTLLDVRRHSSLSWMAAMLGLVMAAAGCGQFTEEPVRVGVAHYDPSLLILPKWTSFSRYLADELDRPVPFQLLKPWQICAHLGTGRLQFAMLTPGDYCALRSDDQHRILAVPINGRGQVRRQGLIITAAESELESVEQIEGRRFHFLPANDVLNQAALGLLLEAGVVEKSLDGGFLGLGLDTRHVSSAEVAKSVIVEKGSAGVIDRDDYERWPETGGVILMPTPIPPLPSKDQVRVIGETVVVPNGPFVASVHADEELVNAVRDCLFTEKLRRNLALASLDCSTFTDPIDPEEYEPFSALYRKLYPSEVEPPEAPSTSTHPPAPLRPGPETPLILPDDE